MYLMTSFYMVCSSQTQSNNKNNAIQKVNWEGEIPKSYQEAFLKYSSLSTPILKCLDNTVPQVILIIPGESHWIRDK